jgi:hypothetical protein
MLIANNVTELTNTTTTVGEVQTSIKEQITTLTGEMVVI